MSEDDIKELLYVRAALQDEIAGMGKSPNQAKRLYVICNAVEAVLWRHTEEIEAHYQRLDPSPVPV